MSSIKFGSLVGLYAALSSNDISQILSVKWLGLSAICFFKQKAFGLDR
jgi:hypothetical protein